MTGHRDDARTRREIALTREIGSLLRDLPSMLGDDVAPEQLQAWHRRKAVLLDQVADFTDDPDRADEARRLADTARARAGDSTPTAGAAGSAAATAHDTDTGEWP